MSKIVFLLSISLLLFGAAVAQVYPVQLSSQLLPPYSSYLPDYGDPTNEKLKSILVLQDFTVTQRDVKLEITIAGNGFTIKTKSSFSPSPITLLPGIPTLISGIDLAPYLETQNLDFTGINAADYELRKILPEGYYSICIKAVDYYNSTYTILSNESCNYAWFFLNDPPFLNFPACETEIDPVTPQNIIFQWTAMNLNSPNSFFNTEYDFELFEWRPNNGIPNNIVQNSAPVFSITTTQPFYQYGILDPTLYLGMKYIWRVRARDLSGRDLFKNDGYSQICSFTYGNINSAFNSDAFTLTLQATASTHRQGKVWWNHISNFTNYLVQVRKAGTENWFDYHSTVSELKINELEPSTAYEARVMGTGTNLESDWSNTATFTTPPLPVYNCNDQTQPINALTSNPLLTATANMVFQIGQFEMRATQITPDPGAPGYFSGFGKVRISLLNIGVKYDHVYINDNLQITAGNVVALSEGIDAWEADWMYNQSLEDVEWFQGNIDSVYVSDSIIYVIDENGDTTPYTFPGMGLPLIINDEDGTQVTIWLNGNIVYGTWMTYSNDYLDCDSTNKVLFSVAEDMIYGLDNYQIQQWADDYEIIKLNDSTNYYVANKSLKTGGSDFVLAKFNNEVSPLSTLTFVTSGGTNLTSEMVGGFVKVRIENVNDGESVYAMVDDLRMGKINIQLFEELEKEIFIVPVGNAGLPNENDLQNAIQETFAQGVVKINLNFKSSYPSTSWDLNSDGKLAAGNFNLLQDYSDEMKKLSNDWLAANEIDKDAYVLFIVPSFDDQNVDKGGYMPLGRHKGFIKSGSDLKVYSHELAHGIFGLEHVFPEVTESSTKNLLDYSNGIRLTYSQWDAMRLKWTQFDLINDEGENFYAMKFTNLNENLTTLEQVTTGCMNFRSKSGNIIHFDQNMLQQIKGYMLKNGRLIGITMDVNGIRREFIQATSVDVTNENDVKVIINPKDNDCFICFECIDEFFEPIEDFTALEITEVVNAQSVEGAAKKVYKRIPTGLLIDLTKYETECAIGIEVVIDIENGTTNCGILTEFDCNDPTGDGTSPLTGEELVDIEMVDEGLYGCSSQFSWVNLFGHAFNADGYDDLACLGYVRGLKRDSKEFVPCYYSGSMVYDQTRFYAYVDKEAFIEKQNALNTSQLKIRIKDLTPEMVITEENFTPSANGDEVHYRDLIRIGCYSEYKFIHDGREEYEFTGYQFKNVEKSIYYRVGCGLQIIQEMLCDQAQLAAEDFAEFVGPILDLSKIPATVYNVEDADYNNIFYSAYVVINPTIWAASESAAEHQFAFVCGLYNGLIGEIEGLTESLPIVVKYLCETEFRQQMNTAIQEMDLEEINNSIMEDFNGNSYQNAEAAGRYTMAIVSLIIPMTKVNWAAKAGSVVSIVKSLPTNVMKFINKIKSNGITGLKVVKGTVQKIIFVNPSNVEIDLIRFTDEGSMVIDETRLVSEAPQNAVELFDIGEVTYKTADDAVDVVDELKVVKGVDGEVWVVKKILQFTSEQIDHYVTLATKQNNNLKVMLGKHDNGGVTGYINRAGSDHSYFDMGSENWNEAKIIVNNNPDEMWRINKKFIDEQKVLGKEFYLSHSPVTDASFYSREIEYLTKPINQGGLGGTIVNLESNLWKIIW